MYIPCVDAHLGNCAITQPAISMGQISFFDNSKVTPIVSISYPFCLELQDEEPQTAYPIMSITWVSHIADILLTER